MAVRVQSELFDMGREVQRLTAGRTDVGAVVTFQGLVRGEAHGKALQSMTLEHYPGMTETELARIEAEARARFDVQDCLIVHRYGKLVPGEPIVLVVAMSPHRQAAFDAASFLMDYLKTRGPFWKKETDTSGEGSWVDARDEDDAALDKWTPGAKV